MSLYMYVVMTVKQSTFSKAFLRITDVKYGPVYTNSCGVCFGIFCNADVWNLYKGAYTQKVIISIVTKIIPDSLITPTWRRKTLSVTSKMLRESRMELLGIYCKLTFDAVNRLIGGLLKLLGLFNLTLCSPLLSSSRHNVVMLIRRFMNNVKFMIYMC
jgi:hypothetical protein